MSRRPANQSILRSVFVIVALGASAVGCDASPAVTPEPSGTPASPAQSETPTTQPTPTSRPAATPSPIPTDLPAPVDGRWVAAGSTSRAYGYGAHLVALPSGGALLLGVPLDDEGVTMDGVLATERWDPKTGWHEGASTDGREDFVAVALRDGRVLVAGGAHNERSLNGATVYDPSAETWTDVAPLADARTHPAAALLPDGRVLVVGGYVWDPDSELGRVSPEVERLRVAAAPPWRELGAALLDVAVPPFGPALATAELFDPATGTWSSTGPMRFARTGPAIAVLTDGQVLVAGADGEPTRIDSRAYRTAEVYDPASGRFSGAGTLAGFDREALARDGVELPEFPPEPGEVGTLVSLRDGGAVLVAREVSWKHEGEVVWSARLAPDLVSWRAVGEPFGQLDTHDPQGERTTRVGVSRLGAVILGLSDGSVLVAGGSPGYSVGGRAPVSVTRYLPGRDTWTDEEDMPEPRDWPLGVSLADGTVLVVGGRPRSDDWAADAYRLSPSLRR